MTSFLSTRAYLAILAIGCLVLAGLAVALPHDPYIRYQLTKGTIFERTRYQYERLHFDPTPIDVVFIGSSRTAGGVDPGILEQQLAKRGLPLNVANLSLPASGMDIRLVEAREALRAHPEIKLMVISTVETFPRDGHQAFADLGTVEDILGSHWLLNRNLPGTLLRLPMRQMKLFGASLFPQAFGYRAQFDPGDYAGTLAPSRMLPGWRQAEAHFPFHSTEHAQEVRTEGARRMREITPPILPERLSWAEFGVSRGSIDDILELARRNGTKVAFLYLPSILGYPEPRETSWLKTRGPLWIARFLQDDPANYADAAHTSPIAVPKLDAWIADRILTQFPIDAPKPGNSDGS